MAFTSLQGQLLIAAPALVDPNFHRTVVLLLEHAEEGALGVVLNRPSTVGVEAVVEPLAAIAASPGCLFSGGPVQPGAAIALGEYADPTRAEALLAGSVGVVDLDEEPAALLAQVTRLRLFAGYAGWGPGQLEAELGEEAWFTAPALPGDVFSAAPDGLWTHVLERKGGQYRLVARMPSDPSWN
jgi:putative transcriptional regulator